MYPAQTPVAAKTSDAAMLILACFIGHLLYLGAWQGQAHVLNLGSDAANIAGFIAATAQPELFVGDEALGDPHNFAEYMTVQIPCALALSRFTGGDYGWAFLLPLNVLGALQIFGFYLLGALVLKSRPLAIALAGASLLVVDVPAISEYWGARGHATPREWFQAVLPWILCAAWRYRFDPRAWASILFCMGLMMYVHPVSAPSWATALWFGFLVSRPQSRPWLRQIRVLIVCTPAFFIAAFPFVSNYLGEHDHGATRLPYEQIYSILKYRFADGYLELPQSIATITARWWSIGLIPAAIVGSLLVWRLRREDQTDLRLLLTWLGGLLLISTLVPVTEQGIAAHVKMIPVEVDFVRGLRYVVPMMQLLTLMGVSVLLLHVPDRMRTVGAVVASAACLWLLSLVATPTSALAKGATRYWNDTPPRRQTQRLVTLLAIRELTPEGATILPASDRDALPLRYLSRRPVVYAWKDGGILAYANHEALVRWYGREREMKKIKRLPEPERTVALFDAARRYDADYLLLNRAIEKPVAAEQHAEIVLRNKAYTLLKL